MSNFREKIALLEQKFKPPGKWIRTELGFQYIILSDRTFFSMTKSEYWGTVAISCESYYMYGDIVSSPSPFPYKVRSHKITCKESHTKSATETSRERALVISEESNLSKQIPFSDTFAETHSHNY